MPDLPEIPPSILGAPDPAVSALERFIHEPDVVPQPRIETIPAAAWAVARIAEARTAIADIHTMAAAWREEINRYERDATEWPRRVVDLLSPEVERFAIAEREASPRDPKGEPTVKTVKLPNGEVRTRGSDVGGTAVTDPDVLVGWLKANMPEAVKTVETPLLPTLKAATRVRFVEGAVYGQLVTADGEVVPGVHVEPGNVTATVHPS